LLSLKYKNLFKSKIKYVYAFFSLSLYKSLSIFKKKENNNSIINFFGKFNLLYSITPCSRKKYDNLRFNYLDKILKIRKSVQTKFNDEYLFMFSNYNNYLDWCSGALQHIIMGKMIKNLLEKGKSYNRKTFLKVRDLLIFEAFYDSINYISQILWYIENWQNNENNPDDHIRTFFNTIHFISVQLIYFIKPEIIFKSSKYIQTFNQLFLINAGYFMLYMVLTSYIIVKIKIREEKKGNTKEEKSNAVKIRDIIIYLSLAFFYGMYLSKIKKVGNILSPEYNTIGSRKQKIMFFLVSNIYVYTFFPLIMFVFGSKENDSENNDKTSASMKRFLSYWNK
jgi:hypothetical protein